MNWHGLVVQLLNQKNVHVSEQEVRNVILRHHVEDWFFYIYKDRSQRWEYWKTSYWISHHVHACARIFEPGCGVGWNLLWLGQHGFRHLYGSDIAPHYIAAGRDLSEIMHLPVSLWVDDSRAPREVRSGPFDVILAFNWIYLLEDYSLEAFVAEYTKYLSNKGLFVIDVIDAAYDEVENNQYLTSDWNKPEVERQVSEYKRRYSREQVCDIARSHGLRVVHRISGPGIIPKYVYVLGPVR